MRTEGRNYWRAASRAVITRQKKKHHLGDQNWNSSGPLGTSVRLLIPNLIVALPIRSHIFERRSARGGRVEPEKAVLV